jgi:hypothetical protein
MTLLASSCRVMLAALLFHSSAWTCRQLDRLWIPRSHTADPLYRFSDPVGSIGYIDQSGRVVLPPDPQLSHVYEGEFHDGLLLLGVADGVYVDTSGDKIIDKGLYRGWDFSEGLAVAMEESRGKWGYINTKGEFAISPRFPAYPDGNVNSFSEGLAEIEIQGKVGYIDRTGEFAIQPRFLDGEPFSDGMARVIVEGPCYFLHDSACSYAGILPTGTRPTGQPPLCKYTFIDKSGTVISDQRYDYALPFGEGLAPVRVGKSWGYINKAGEMVIPPRFESAAPFSDGLGLVSEKKRFGFVDRNGNYAIPPQFRWAESFTDGLAVVSERATYGQQNYWYIDRDGQQAFPARFRMATSFFKGLAHVQISERHPSLPRGAFAYIDTTGKIVFSYGANP